MPNWKKVIVSGSSAELTTLKLTGTSGQSSEATSLMINSSGVVGTRELGSNAFNSNTYNNYSLPLGSSSTRGGFKIGYTESGKNYPVEISSEKMYVNVPWTDTNTDTNTFRAVRTTNGETGTTLGSTETLHLVAGTNVSLSESEGEVTISSTDTNTNTFRNVTAGGNTLGSTESLDFIAGSNVSISESGGNITISSTDTNTDTNTTYSAGSGLSLSGTTFSHTDTSSAGSVNNSGNTVIQDVTLDTYGHVTGLTSKALSIPSSADIIGEFSAGDGIEITDDGEISSTVTNTNTTYSADGNYGMTLSGTSFRLENDRRRNSTSTDIYTGNTHDYTFYDASVGIRWYAAGAEDMRLANGGTLHVDGDVVAYSTTISDERLKDNVTTIENPLDKIKALRGVEYDWNAGSRKGKRDLGLIAQEVEKVIPNIVHEHEQPLLNDDEDDKTLYKTVDYEKMVAVLIEGMKEQQSQIDELKSEINQLKGKM
jgi:hypothetical protein